MKCPSCSKKLKKTNASGVDTLTCTQCDGLWVSHDSMAALFNAEKLELDLHDLIRKAPNKYLSKRNCVSCPDQILKIIDSGGVEIDACEKCGGIYFDENEIKAMLPHTHTPINSILAAFTPRDGLGRVLASLIY
ncbi:MAG: zf-TFIIB domain-containing protein [Porticoccaceae bacterium]|nr:zf-TFIIB domain-containing protein [Porticoccaceae bacterium]